MSHDQDVMMSEGRNSASDEISSKKNMEIGKELKLTRIIVKGLPSHVTNSQFKKLFEEFGQVTDAKIMQTKTGKSRCFGYIGYKKHEEAVHAINERHQTFIGMAKIIVEFALPYNDSRLDAPRSKHSNVKAATSASGVKSSTFEKKDVNEEVDQFLNVGKKKASAPKFWENDLEDEFDDQLKKDKIINEKDDNNESATKKKREEDSKIEPAEKEDVLYFDENDDEDTGRLFVYNLHFTTTEDELKELFEPFGEISELHIPIDNETKISRGVAFVHFLIPENADKAKKALHNSIFQGRMIHIAKAKEKPNFNVEKENMFLGKSKFKREQLKKLREQAGSSHNWNATHMATNTVMESMSRQLGVSKSELLMNNKDFSNVDDNAAVRMALAETELIKQTKEELQDHGINLDLLNKPANQVKQSRTTILVKNIPFNENTEKLKQELYDLFAFKTRRISRLIIPSSRTIALIEFYEPVEARQAFTHLAYKNFYNVPLYLQWAPEGVLPPKKEEEKKEKKEEQEKKEEKKKEGPVRVADEGDDNQQSTVLFIKNLNFKTTEDSLRELFKSYNPRSVRIVVENGKSKGFGFAEFNNVKEAVKAHEELHNAQLDNHILVIHYSNIQSNVKTSTEPKLKKQDVSFKDEEKGVTVTFKKLVVRNVAFEATRQDLLQLFSAYGQVKTVRLPKKVGSNSHRGFAFIEFVSPKECHAAYQALKHSHLYGRTLKIEFSEDVNMDNIKDVHARQKEDYLEKESSTRKNSSGKRKRDAFL
ncbi:RNA binding domain-containing protein [Naegleria gruberi]|uniref:RNA binding domain-containing protein n=1 Tax=Naegleria gruberi TaxID=5762 RepID=D2V9G7_NAEGR|nr:RNA binding domain-containing protein [Naegleria gruberi]EFC46455.1 RNA binding domain-containing protein [Naegleria gruberi]|eukprot:XP_002679199.1 RNA binding domain-containing protein [Naegleria gruberi strain NEG-M]